MQQSLDEVLDKNLEHPRRPGIALDEWNVWYRSSHCSEADLEETFNFTDALTVASLLHVVLRNPNTVKLSNISLLCNTMASVFTDYERIVRQTIFHPQTMLRAHTGRVVSSIVDGPTFAAKHERFFRGIVDVETAKDETRSSLLHFKTVPALDVVVTVDEAKKKVAISIVQKLEDESVKIRFNWQGLSPSRTAKLIQLRHDDLNAENTLDHPERVTVSKPRELTGDVLVLPPASFSVLEWSLEP